MRLNCHYMDKVNPLAKRLKGEVLLDTIHKLEDQGGIGVNDPPQISSPC